ncbi:winged helix-turn-helix domain-containing protein [Candidatus Pacearchaeota archaeon]|nr:winged helix-turn-helix domain-containing protein [Candidatus Pacearchaeota archaeon]
MKQTELVYREILHRAIERKEFSLTQSEISKKLGISLSIINLAVKKLESIGAIRIMQRSFRIIDVKKAIYYWASARNFEKDIIFRARIEIPVREIEKNMPNIIFTGYSAYKLLFNDVPADYSEIYVYADEQELEVIKKRFKEFEEESKNSNLIVLKKDKLMESYARITIAQIFVDLWNMKEWYAKEFINSFEKKLKLV